MAQKIRLQYWREKKHLTRTDLARMAKIQQNTVGKIENGKSFPQLGTLRKLAEAMDISLDDLLVEEDEEASSPHHQARVA